MWQWFSQFQWQIDVAAAIMALLAFLASIWFGWRQWKLQREALRLQRDSDIVAWSDTVMDTCCRAEMLLRPEYAAITDEHAFEKNRFETLAALSSSIDKGRLYFPNIEQNRYGLQKEAAFRGMRHEALDQLVGVYDLLRQITHKSPDARGRAEAREQVSAHKREFISIVQAEVDPRRRVRFLQKSSRH